MMSSASPRDCWTRERGHFSGEPAGFVVWLLGAPESRRIFSVLMRPWCPGRTWNREIGAQHETGAPSDSAVHLTPSLAGSDPTAGMRQRRCKAGARSIDIPSAATTTSVSATRPLVRFGQGCVVHFAQQSEGQPGQPGAIGSESGGRPTKQGAPVERVEGPRGL